MRYLSLASLVLLAAPALAQTGAVPAPAVPAPAATAASPVPCTCGPVPVRTAVRRVRRTTAQTPAVAAYQPAPPAFAATTTAPAPEPLPPVPGGILGPAASPYNESIVYLGLGYTDGYIGSEAGAGGSGPLHAGY